MHNQSKLDLLKTIKLKSFCSSNRFKSYLAAMCSGVSKSFDVTPAAALFVAIKREMFCKEVTVFENNSVIERAIKGRRE